MICYILFVDYRVFYILLFLLVFFFKQKTAYEMRISDWSSDVCSSDLFGKQYGLAGTLGGGIAAAVRPPRTPMGPGNKSRDDSDLLRLSGRERSEERRVGKECVSTG